MASLSPEMPPDLQGFAESARRLRLMMVYHLVGVTIGAGLAFGKR
jgi:hypothetical protein